MSDRSSVPWLSTAICGMAVLVFIGGPSWEARLILEREAAWPSFIPALWTCHLVHAGAGHLLLNLLAGLLALGWLERCSRGLALVTVLVTAPCVALAALVAMPEIARYCGLSGLIHGAAGALLAVGFFRGQRWLAAGGLLLGGAKLLWEWRSGGSLFLDQAGQAMLSTPAAHACGLLCGVATGALWEWRRVRGGG